ncbi:NAD(P)/FAD-dependent oxidoreductase [Cellulosimicrobium protaetiae]|uniref:Pyridine nucleotide-disulfide oxidoreductase domain-containing protein 2 n=1 Tax=Cellulosimicrobium protaetiae TaxID=2587808 RepID=A0A6M5UL88_9MICO|nr:NAD(P)/FAD-dependent oxidoreductase [Cellulosimicrobium protaetiae]
MPVTAQRHDVAIVGGGHNALVAAALLAREGLDVVVLERLPHVGGAAVSERPWPGVDARLSRYAYLVSLFPEALAADLGLDLELRSRATASFTPYDGPRGPAGLLVETEPGAATRASFRALTGGDDEYAAWQELYAELEGLAQVVAPTLLEPLPREGDVHARVRAAVGQRVWTDVVERPIGEAIERRFRNDLVRGVVATDALIGTFTSLFDPARPANRCFLYHVVGNGTGEWRVPVGGMGAVTAALERAARAAGADVRTGHEVTRVVPDGAGVGLEGRLASGEGFAVEADHVLCGAAPAVLARLLGEEPAGPVPHGAQLKINLLVSRLPRLRSGVDPRVAFAGTFHVGEEMSRLEALHRDPATGLGTAGELYCHTLTDRSILGPDLAASDAQTLTWFGIHTPDDALRAPGAKDAAFRAAVAALDAHLAEPLADVLLHAEVRTPAEIEADLAMPGGHIFHGDLAWPWLPDDVPAHTPAARWGVATDHERVLLCGSGARRGGAVSGLGGHSAARALLETLSPR